MKNIYTDSINDPLVTSLQSILLKTANDTDEILIGDVIYDRAKKKQIEILLSNSNRRYVLLLLELKLNVKLYLRPAE